MPSPPTSTPWVPVWPVTPGSVVDYIGDWSAATAYLPGAVVLYNGVQYIAVNPSTNQVPGAAALGGIGTSLPASPYDGMEYTLVDSLTAPTYAWRFRYVSGISDANKWVFVGGSAALTEVTTGETTTSATYVALTTPGPSFTVPRAGLYEVHIGATMRHTSTLQECIMSFDIGGTAATDTDAAFWNSSPASGKSVSVSRARQRAIAAAATALVSKYRTGGATAQFENRWMRVTPVRVA